MNDIFKIPLDELEEGMIVVKFDKGGFSFSHYGHPFPDNLLKQYLKRNGVKEVYIRKAKKEETVKASEAFIEYETQLTEISKDPLELPLPSLKDINKIISIRNKAKRVTYALLNDVRQGKSLDATLTKEIIKELVEHCINSPEAFINITRLKQYDNYTYIHSVNVAVLSIAIGKEMGESEQVLNELGAAGLLHDIGKMKIPEYIINKPGKLTPEEFELMKKHPEYGYDHLKRDNTLSKDILTAVRQHHEKADGTGYPDRLRDEDISNFSKIVSIADVYDAITSERSYHKGMIPSDALKVIFSWSGKHFNDSLVKFFINTMGIYPAGALVVLNTNELAVILETDKSNPMRPIVLIISNNQMEPVSPYLFDLTRYDILTQLPYKSIVSSLDPRDFSVDTDQIIEKYALAFENERARQSIIRAI